MPSRPPKAWWDRCMADVRASGTAADPAAVCGAVWKRKSPSEKRATIALEEGGRMASKKKTKKTKKKAEKKREKKRPAKRAKKPSKHHGRCVACGHSHKGPCLHMKGHHLCPCPRPVHKAA